MPTTYERLNELESDRKLYIGLYAAALGVVIAGIVMLATGDLRAKGQGGVADIHMESLCQFKQPGTQSFTISTNDTTIPTINVYCDSPQQNAGLGT